MPTQMVLPFMIVQLLLLWRRCSGVAVIVAMTKCRCRSVVGVSIVSRAARATQFQGFRDNIYSMKSMSDSCHHLGTSAHARDSYTTTADLARVRCDAGRSQTRHRARNNAALVAQCITCLFKLAVVVQSHCSTALVM